MINHTRLSKYYIFTLKNLALLFHFLICRMESRPPTYVVTNNKVETDHVIITKTSPRGVLPVSDRDDEDPLDEDILHLYTNDRPRAHTYFVGAQFELKFDWNIEFISNWYFSVKPYQQYKMDFVSAYQCPTQGRFIILIEARQILPPLKRKSCIGKLTAFEKRSSFLDERFACPVLCSPPQLHYNLCDTCELEP